MARNFYFGKDATMVSGSAVFSAAVNADPSAFGLSGAEALAYSEIDAVLQSAYHAAETPATRTSVTVSQKNAAVKAMQRSARALSDVIRATPAVNDAQLISLGLLPRPRRTRRRAPDAAPLVRVVSVVGRVVTIRVCDKDSASRRSKPFAAIGAQIFSYVGDESPGHQGAYRYERLTCRTTATITFPNDVRSGATVWLSACWVTARGETSVGSAPICFTLQGGAISAAASDLVRAAA